MTPHGYIEIDCAGNADRARALAVPNPPADLLKENIFMFVNLSSDSREQLLSLVQTMHLSEADVIAWAIKLLFDEKNPNQAGIIGKDQTKRRRPGA